MVEAGTNTGSVNEFAAQTDGCIVMIGNFNIDNDASAIDIARLDAHGSLDNTSCGSASNIPEVEPVHAVSLTLASDADAAWRSAPASLLEALANQVAQDIQL